MGNAIRRLTACCDEPSTSDQFHVGGQYPGQYPGHYPGQFPGHHPGQFPGQYPGQFPSQFPGQHPGQYPGQYPGQGVPQGGTPSSGPPDSVGLNALARDLGRFETTNKVPEELSQHIKSTKATQVNWFRKLLAAWKSAQPVPTTPEEASILVKRTLQGCRIADVQGLLNFYGLPTVPAAENGRPQPLAFVLGGTWPQGVKFEISTLPVEARAVADGDTITVYVDVYKDAREKSYLPQAVVDAAKKRRTAQAQHDTATAKAMQAIIQEAGYKVFDGKNGKEDCLARKYRIRLKGIDAPESSQPFGQQAKAALISLVEGRPLLIHVYTTDQYGRLVGDIHCNNVFIQEALLKKGCAWHYTDYDDRPTFAKWEKAAKAARVGLWAVDNPEKPWDYRKSRRSISPGASL